MSRTTLTRALPLLLAGALMVAACPPKLGMPHLGDEDRNDDIVGPPSPGPDLALDVDILIDGTTSMSGYAVAGESVFNRFVEELEAAIRSGSKQSKIAFFKFGTSIKPIGRDVAILRKAPAFFAEPGIFEQTRLEDAVANVAPTKDRILLTDLFQNEGDVNKVVAALKEKCFDKNLDVGILMVKSEFDGMVYDAKVPPYRYVTKSDRPETHRAFFAIFVGDADRFVRIYRALKSTRVASALDDQAFLVLSRTAVKGYKVRFELLKTKDKKIQIAKSSEPNPFDNKVDIALGTGAGVEELIARVTVERNLYGPRFNLAKVSLQAIAVAPKTGAKRNDPPEAKPTQDVKLKSLEAKEDELSATLAIGSPTETNRKSGKMLYKVLLELPTDLDGFAPPPPFLNQSSENPRPGADPQKTIHLEKFTRDLIRGWATAQTRYAAKAYIHADRK